MPRTVAAVLAAISAAAVLAACSSTAVTGEGTAAPVRPSTSQSGFPASSTPPSSTPPSSTPAELTRNFAGTWTGHGRVLVFTGAVGRVDYRIYQWCSDDPTPPCDTVQGDTIIDGGRVTIRLASVHATGSATVGVGEVTSSTDPSTAATGTQIAAQVRDGELTMSSFGAFCSPAVPPAQAAQDCGA